MLLTVRCSSCVDLLLHASTVTVITLELLLYKFNLVLLSPVTVSTLILDLTFCLELYVIFNIHLLELFYKTLYYVMLLSVPYFL